MEKFSKRILPFFLFLITLSGCANLGPVYRNVDSIPQKKGLVYIYRPSAFVGGGVSYNVKTGEKVITTLYSGGYYPYFSDPGEVEFWAKTESKSAVTLDVKTGETYYLKGTVGVGFLIGRPHLMFVTPDIAKTEIQRTKLIPEYQERKPRKKIGKNLRR
ncbi:MAG: hypothetical protein GXO96_05325 [Nitrospirae bacterium]|nr:hypothetical protein [Candidatus Manganitrophaceae bacterium]